MKHCNRCDTTKEETEFHKSKRSKDGLTHWCKECNREVARDSYNANPDATNNRKKQWRKDNPDLARERDRKNNSRSKEYRRKYYEDYHKRRPFAAPARNSVQNAKRRGVESLNFREMEEAMKSISDMYPYCLACGAVDYLEFDHIMPLALGGPNHPDNLQVLCRHCNSKKHATYKDYR